MIGISIAANREWRWVLEKFELSSDELERYPFGEYFKKSMFGEEIIIYKCGHKSTKHWISYCPTDLFKSTVTSLNLIH